MPAALQVDREAARVLCVAVGVREAARKLGVPEGTMQAWSARGQWFAKPVQPPTVIRQTGPNSLATTATNAGESLAESLADDSKATRIGLSQASRRAAEHLKDQTGAGILKSAKAMKEIAGVASIVHGWSDGKATNVQINLAIGIGGVE